MGDPSTLYQETGRLRPGWRILAFVLGLAVVVAVINVGWRALGLPGPRVDGVEQPMSLMAMGVLVALATLGLIAVLLRRLEQRSLATLGLPLTRPWLRGLGVGLLLGIVPVTGVVAFLGLIGHADISRSNLSTEALPGLIAVVIGIAVLSTWEELTFRGYLLQQLREGLGAWPAVILTGLFWGLMHGFNPGANQLGLINTAVSGVMLGWLTLRTGSLWLPIGAHIGWNVTAAHVFGITVSGLEGGHSLMVTELTGSVWLNGGDYGFEAGIPAGVLDLAIMALALRFAHRLPGHPELKKYFGSDGRA